MCWASQHYSIGDLVQVAILMIVMSISERQDTWFADDSPIINNKPVALAVGDWYFDRATVKAVDCAYPCDRTCHNLIATVTTVISQILHELALLLHLVNVMKLPTVVMIGVTGQCTSCKNSKEDLEIGVHLANISSLTCSKEKMVQSPTKTSIQGIAKRLGVHCMGDDLVVQVVRGENRLL
ncbi:hypothetical protein SASPL_124471 [Salvia splendens]|uniref:Pectin acetylesterase n=1 Tax=Salvia splendens TaxID=180675 RepID=A0A8X8XMA2_SALSN|nr:hypothetical protein SASPL_124471 [Salvia splendens]